VMVMAPVAVAFILDASVNVVGLASPTSGAPDAVWPGVDPIASGVPLFSLAGVIMRCHRAIQTRFTFMQKGLLLRHMLLNFIGVMKLP